MAPHDPLFILIDMLVAVFAAASAPRADQGADILDLWDGQQWTPKALELAGETL